jgi:hypothetical protein
VKSRRPHKIDQRLAARQANHPVDHRDAQIAKGHTRPGSRNPHKSASVK